MSTSPIRNHTLRNRARRAAFLLGTALTSAALLSATSPQSACPVPHVSPAALQAAAVHNASVLAETVAPSVGTDAITSGKRRAYHPPQKFDNFIDTDVFNKLAADGIPPTTKSTDAEFLRRVTLDLTGQIPDAATVTAFLADNTADKRTKMIDQLLASDAFTDRWSMWLGDLVQNVQVATNVREYFVGRNTYYSWIRTQIQQGKPYDEVVRGLVAGSGDSFAAGNADYVVRQLQPNGPAQDTYDNLAAHSGEKFLGMPMLCLSCHNGIGHLTDVNSYLAHKTRMDFWKSAAFFARVTARPTQTPEYGGNVKKFTVADSLAGAYNLNTTSGNKTIRSPVDGMSSVTPAFIFTGEQPRAGESWRDAYGRMLTADPQFARATVNYLWKEMFGLGLVEPTNNIDPSRLDPATLAAGATIQPINPTLLADLTNSFRQGGYSLKGILRVMATSEAYQLSSQYTPGPWNEAWTSDFPRHYPQRLSAEAMLDAVARSTNIPLSMNVNGLGSMTKAMALPDPTEPNSRSSYGSFLNEFGRGNRDDEGRSNDASISQALSLMNNTIVTSRIKQTAGSGTSTVGKTLKASTDPATIADAIYLNTLSRHATASELTTAVAYLKSGNLGQKTEDLQFALLNELEFLFN